MRSTLLVLVTLTLALGGFFLYRTLQPTPTRAVHGAVETLLATPVRNGMPRIGIAAAGDRPWIRNIDRLGRLASRFRASEYQPQPDGRWVHVIDPQAEFFQYPPGRVQRVYITGSTGDIEVQQTPGASAMSSKSASGPPKRGWLKDVTIQLFPNDLGPTKGKPSLTLRTDNINFDNERFVVQTADAHGPDGTVIPADQIPIHVTGDYEFEGKGLTLVWNDLEGRLEDLHVAHGEYLTILHPSSGGSSMFGGSDHVHPTTEPTATLASDILPSAPPTVGSAPPASAAVDPAAEGRKRAQPPYLATFERDVRISQGPRGDSEVPLAWADHMSMDFMLNGPKQAAPATQPVGDATASAATPPTSAPALAEALGPQTQVSVATTEPAVQPVTVRWNGELVVIPQPTPVGIKAGESIVHMIGKSDAVHVKRDGRDVHCATLDYSSPAGDVAMAGSDALGPVIIRQIPTTQLAAAGSAAEPEESVITTQSLHYNGIEHIALLEGNSDAQVRTKPEPTDVGAKPGMLEIRWQKLARIFLLPKASGVEASGLPKLSVDHAHLEGAVDVQHPQLSLRSEALDAEFDPPATAAGPATQPANASRQPNLRHLVATDAVNCKIIDEQGRRQNVECQHMTMDMGHSEAGKLYPKVVNFEGQPAVPAHAFDSTQDLHAGHIRLTFVPTTNPSTATMPAAPTVAAASTGTGGVAATTRPAKLAEVDTVVADDRVRITTKDGASADAEHLFVKMIDGSPHARLTGNPGTAAAWARVIDAKKNVIIGPVITSDPKQNIATVQGPGSMHLIRQSSPTEKPRPVDLTFKTAAVMDMPRNAIDIQDMTGVRSVDPDGTVTTATGQQLHITLADKPPEALPPHPSIPATQPADDGGMSFTGMKNKAVTGLILTKSVVLKSRLTDAAGALLREMELKSEQVRYEQPVPEAGRGTRTKVARGRMIVPVPGQMLMRDYRSAAQSAGADPSNSRGSTAFQWAKDLTYDESTNTAVLTQDVWVVHLDDQPNAEPARLHADQVTAVFEPKPSTGTKSATQESDPESHLQLKSMLATGNVTVTRSGSNLSAPTMTYDPATGWMNAIGTDRNPARYVDETGTRSGVGQEIDWNARTWEPRFKQARMTSRPPRQ